MVAQVEYSVAGRLRGQVMPCAVCTIHVKMKSAGFLVEPQNQGRWFVSSLASKPLETVCQFGLKTTGMIFSNLASKPMAMVSPGLASKKVVGFLVEPQN
jgi:hypothetical protein